MPLYYQTFSIYTNFRKVSSALILLAPFILAATLRQRQNKLQIRVIKLLLAKLIPYFRDKLRILYYPGKPIPKADLNHNNGYTYNLKEALDISKSYLSTIQAISCPILIIIGRQDEYLQSAKLQNQLITLQPVISKLKLLMVDKANHFNVCLYGLPIITDWIKTI